MDVILNRQWQQWTSVLQQRCILLSNVHLCSLVYPWIPFYKITKKNKSICGKSSVLWSETSTSATQVIFTARKRSLRRLCFYTCLSFCSRVGGCAWQGACVAGGVHGRGACVAGGMHAMPPTPPRTLRDTVGQCAGGTHPTGMHSCFL